MLGPLEATTAGGAVDLGRRKQRAVLAVLAVSVNRVVSLDRLISLLWGDEAPGRATAALQAYICNLRRVMEPTRVARAPTQVLVTQAPGYMLCLGSDALDASRFEALATTGHGLVEARRPAAARRALEDALSLWRGPVLGEFSCEPFARVEAVRLDELRAAAFEGLVRCELALGEHARAVAELELAVAEWPLRENLWGMLMVALYRSGRQGDALRAFARARTVLAEELGVDPSPALRAIEDDVLAHAPRLDWVPPPAEDGVARPRPVDPPGFAAEVAVEIDSVVAAMDEAVGEAETPARAVTAGPDGRTMVGREREMAVLAAALDHACDERGRLVLVSGEAGIGKTRLAEELARRALAAGAVVAWGRSSDTEGAPSFWPWSQVLRTVLDGADPRDLGPETADIAQLLPDAAPPVPLAEPTAPSDPAAARFRLCQGVTSLLLRLARRRPLVVVIDDLHWADRPSGQLLLHLAAQLGQSRLLVVVTYRSEPRWAEGLLETLGELGRLQPLERIELVGLGLDEVRTFLAEATGVVPSAADAADAHRRTNGNPFFLAEVARLMASEGPVARAVPTGIREVIGRRLARLPDQTRWLLLVAAVVGQMFDLAVVAEAGEVSLDHALDFIDPAVVTGIVEEDDERPGRYRFGHALVQETVYGGASGLRRARLHGKVGEAIEGLGLPASRLPELAYHFAEAAAAAGAERGISYAIMAAEAATEGPAPEAAEDHLRRALALLETLPEGPERDLQELTVQDRLATLLSMVRGITEPTAKPVWDRAIELCRRHGDPRLLLRSLWGIFGYAIARARLEDAGQVAQQMLQLGATCDDVTAAVAGHVAAGGVAFHSGDFVMADAQFAQALELAEDRPDPGLADVLFLHLPATAGVYRGMVRQVLGHRTDGVALSRAAVERARAEGGPFALSFVLHVDAFACIFAGDLHALRCRADEMFDLADRNNFGDFRSEALLFRGWLEACDGDAAAGLAAVVDGVDALRAVGLRLQGTLYSGLLADTQRRAGRFEEAARTLEAGIADMEATGERFYEAELHRLRSEVLRDRLRAETEDLQASQHTAAEIAEAQGAMLFRLRAEATIGAPAVAADKS